MKNANVSSEKIIKVRRMAGVPVRSGVKAGKIHEFGGPRGGELGKPGKPGDPGGLGPGGRF